MTDKYKVWDSVNKVWDNKPSRLSMYLHVNGDQTCFIVSTAAKRLMPVRSTGRLDDDGREIFAGDILDAQASADFPDDSVISDVIWNETDYQFQIRTRQDGGSYSHGLPLGWGAWKSLKIIGNIYENPELLEGKS